VPKANRAYWIGKVSRNKQRDHNVLRHLRKIGWKPIVVWECELKDEAKLKRRLRRLLSYQQPSDKAYLRSSNPILAEWASKEDSAAYDHL
jgi:G:T-mismatch repair DNA endonuclease (very short patch repair protein)